MISPNGSDDEVRELFRKHVPEVASGVVDIVAVAREPGQYTMVAVRSHDTAINPVSVCAGKGGVRREIMKALGGGITIFSWSESASEFISRTVLSRSRGPSRPPKVTLDETTHRAHVLVARDALDYMSSRDGLLLKLASRLVGWEIELSAYD